MDKFSADDAMRQAHMTADTYAHEASVTFFKIYGYEPHQNPLASAIFMAAFMRTAAQDFHPWRVGAIADRITDA